MSGADLTTMAHIFTRKFGGKKPQEIIERDHVRFKRMRKKPGFNGQDYDYHLLTGNPQAISGAFSSAQTAAASATSKGKRPVATRKAKYGIVRLDYQAILASQGNDGAFYDLTVRETNGTLITFGDRHAFDMYGDGTAARGIVSSVLGNVVTLTISDNVRNFSEGQILIADDTATGASPRSGTAKVASIGGTNTITLDNAAGISGLTGGDYLFIDGEQSTAVEGLAVCTPLTEPSSGDSFRGIDRSVNVPRLSGQRISDLNSTIEENLGLGCVKCSQVGLAHVPTEAYLNPINFFQVARRQGAKVMYTNDITTAKIGFQYIDIITATGAMRVFSDPDCPTTLGYGENPMYDYVHHLGDFPHVVKDGDKPMCTINDALGFEGRYVSFGNYIQEDPAAHFVIRIS